MTSCMNASNEFMKRQGIIAVANGHKDGASKRHKISTFRTSVRREHGSERQYTLRLNLTANGTRSKTSR